ncbi:hypothetical protein [Streptomyces yangpuensis]|uniref:hypothetical protein n=1 Tax=Streptomyces yangpuensis TaxID=1648182 RepID=UPI003681D8D7
MEWFEEARAAEEGQDWDRAIALVSAHAECYSPNSRRHDSHLWHMDLLARAERLSELAELALTDVHARRKLNRALRERDMEAVLHRRAEGGDADALYVLLRLLGEAGRFQEARRAVQQIGPADAYAQQLVADCGPSASAAQ